MHINDIIYACMNLPATSPALVEYFVPENMPLYFTALGNTCLLVTIRLHSAIVTFRSFDRRYSSPRSTVRVSLLPPSSIAVRSNGPKYCT